MLLCLLGETTSEESTCLRRQLIRVSACHRDWCRQAYAAKLKLNLIVLDFAVWLDNLGEVSNASMVD